jgi:hypothetical protein
MSLSAENRNATQMPIVLRQRVQCCSLCRQRGHNITTCNSDRLLEFEVICADAVINFDNTDDFKNWLIQNYINDQLLLKAFAIRKYRLTTRCNLEQYIHFITEYIFRTYKNTPQTLTQPATIHQPVTLIQPAATLTPLNSELVNHYETEFTNLLITIRNRNVIREQILDQQIAEADMMRTYISYLSYLGSLIVRDEYQIQMPQNQRRTPNLMLTVETDLEENLDENCQCSICWDDKERRQFVKLDCTHEFCKDCMKRTIETRTNLCCALCRSELRTIRLRTPEVRAELAEVVA